MFSSALRLSMIYSCEGIDLIIYWRQSLPALKLVASCRDLQRQPEKTYGKASRKSLDAAIPGACLHTLASLMVSIPEVRNLMADIFYTLKNQQPIMPSVEQFQFHPFNLLFALSSQLLHLPVQVIRCRLPSLRCWSWNVGVGLLFQPSLLQLTLKPFSLVPCFVELPSSQA